MCNRKKKKNNVWLPLKSLSFSHQQNMLFNRLLNGALKKAMQLVSWKWNGPWKTDCGSKQALEMIVGVKWPTEIIARVKRPIEYIAGVTQPYASFVKVQPYQRFSGRGE